MFVFAQLISLSLKEMRIAVSLVISLFSCFSMQGKEVPRNERQCIVQLSCNIELYAQRHPELKSYKQISKTLNVYLLDLYQTYSDSKLKLESDYSVLSIQPNNRVYKRYEPNDPRYGSQWQFPKIGMEQIWDRPDVKNGLTKAGDTIVIAIVDDGVDVTNPDLMANMWINYHDNPNDTLDNDSNGYKNDYLGWNTLEQNDEIFDPATKGRHGTPIAGIIGAVGDNAEGVAGLNWKIKILNVVGGVFEADVIESYDYIMQLKKLYIQSNGQKGAYIVASNSSWGKEGSKEEDSPLWCAMYDSLGKYGIINFGATSNATNYDVDLRGDLPSSCSSPYLVSVTNVDSKYESSTGKGIVNVDIGAPGTSTITTASRVDTAANNGWYRNFGATSGATAYATGAIGVLYQYGCNEFIELHQKYPDSAALMARKFMFDGVDPSSFLSDRVSTGGVLNIKRMLDKMDEWCTKRLGSIQTISNQINLYPNPANESVYFNNQLGRYREMFVMDGLAKNVYTQTNLPTGKVTMEVNSWPKGIYYVIVSDAFGNRSRSKLIVQ